MAVKDYSTDPDMNVQISGINIAEGCAPSGINNAIRQMMADAKEESVAQTQTVTKQVTDLDSTLRTLITKELKKYLPLAGGTMTGPLNMAASINMREWVNINFGPNSHIFTKQDDGAFTIHGGSKWDSCAKMSFVGKDSSTDAGDLVLNGYRASDGWTTELRVDGSERVVKVNGNEVLTSAGGTMTGGITISAGENGMVRAGSTGRIVFMGGENWAGGNIILHGRDHASNPGLVVIQAPDGTNNSVLRLEAAGSALWRGSPILTLVASWKDGSNWYRKYSDGWIEQGGTMTKLYNETVTFHTAFATAGSINVLASVSSNYGSNDYIIRTHDWTVTSFKMTVSNGGGGTRGDAKFTWYACGY